MLMGLYSQIGRQVVQEIVLTCCSTNIARKGLSKHVCSHAHTNKIAHVYTHVHTHTHLHAQVEQWVMFDDTTVSTIGSWEAVLTKCSKGRIQPCLLFYELPLH